MEIESQLGGPPVVVVFPGQGSQRVGMARDFHDAVAVSRLVFEQSSDALGVDMRALCFEGEGTEAGVSLGLTEYTQPAILTAEIAMLRGLAEEFGFAPTHFGGHSLGEYTALVAAGVVPFVDAVVLVRERGRRMQAAVAPGAGAMVAIIGPALRLDAIQAAIDGLAVDVANINSSDQIVLSGATDDIDVALARIRALDDMHARFVKLDVSAPFHSRMMAGIETGFRAVLGASFLAWEVEHAHRVLSNFTGLFHMDRRQPLLDSLTRQISGSVRWTQNMQEIITLNPAAVYEVGPARPLSRFLRTVGVDAVAIGKLSRAQEAFSKA